MMTQNELPIEMSHEPTQNICPRCGAARLRSWGELSDEEREVARRLPAATDFNSGERERTHRWCVRCWFEETHDAGRIA